MDSRSGNGFSRCGEYGLVGIQAQAPDSRRRRQREASLGALRKYPPQIDLVGSYNSVHGNTGHQVIGGVNLAQYRAPRGVPGTGRETRIFELKRGKHSSIHPAVEKPVERMSILEPERLGERRLKF